MGPIVTESRHHVPHHITPRNCSINVWDHYLRPEVPQEDVSRDSLLTLQPAFHCEDYRVFTRLEVQTGKLLWAWCQCLDRDDAWLLLNLTEFILVICSALLLLWRAFDFFIRRSITVIWKLMIIHLKHLINPCLLLQLLGIRKHLIIQTHTNLVRW